MNYALGDDHPLTAGDDFFVAPNAAVIGKVTFEKDASICFGATLRADNEPIVVGAGSNVQDGCVLHTDPGFPLTIGSGVTIGHLVMLHGCTIGDGSLIGIGSTILNGATIGRNCLVGAHALITEGKEIPDGSVVLGSPGRIKRQVTPTDIENFTRAAQGYVTRYKAYRQTLVATTTQT